jgi:VWFA-related protein
MKMKKAYRLALSLALLLLAATTSGAQSPIIVRIDQVDTANFPDVAVSLTARNANGVPLLALTADNLEVTEDRASEPRQVIAVLPYVNTEAQIAVVLAVDISGSMQGQPVEDAKAAAAQFVTRLAPKDAAALIAFNQSISLAAPFPQLDPAREHAFSADKTQLQATIGKLQAQGPTPLYDAAYKAVLLAAQQPEGNRAVLLFTDGKDEGHTPDQPGSAIATTEDAIQEANRHNIPIFTIGLGDGIDRQWLERAAMRTGGTYQQAPSSAELTRLFQNVADLLKQQYRVTYRSTVPTDGGMHYLRVDVKQGVQHAFDAREWGPVPRQEAATSTPPAPAPQPTPVPAPPSGLPLPVMVGGAAVLGVLALVGLLRVARRKPKAVKLICPTCGREVGPDGMCPDCRKPGRPEPKRS